ncbi:hypothetical protein C5167_024918 [Papaver somniferum]|uniref:Uncharacterized protein n=1 Tax=Papaver somniferum TaxID=3469 RepID=A0A4Y7JQ00_PAPSO|nr:hypothetical protein C5167_024918 [Papaver somniferum]
MGSRTERGEWTCHIQDVIFAHRDGTREASLKFGNSQGPQHMHAPGRHQFVDLIANLISKLGSGLTQNNGFNWLYLVMLQNSYESGGGALRPATRSSSVQITLEKLTSVCVGYCWKDLNDEDWELEEVVCSLDPSPIKNYRSALFTFNLFYGLLEQQEGDPGGSSSVKA